MGDDAGRATRARENSRGGHHWCHSAPADMLLSWTRIHQSGVLCKQWLYWWESARRRWSTCQSPGASSPAQHLGWQAQGNQIPHCF